MTDYLDRIVARGLDGAVAVRPRPRPLFEDGSRDGPSPSEVAEEPAFVRSPVPLSGARRPPAERPPVPAAARPVQLAAPTTWPEGTAPRTPPPIPPSGAERTRPASVRAARPVAVTPSHQLVAGALPEPRQAAPHTGPRRARATPSPGPVAAEKEDGRRPAPEPQERPAPPPTQRPRVRPRSSEVTSPPSPQPEPARVESTPAGPSATDAPRESVSLRPPDAPSPRPPLGARTIEPSSLHRPAPPDRSPRDAGAPERAAPAPTVHVTIGRVEVRATHAPAASARPRSAPPPVMSLDEYLKRRAEGGTT
jgi:hypothetical protein